MIITVSSQDPILHVLAPVALAATAGTGLIVDRDPAAGWPFAVGSLQALITAGPTRADLHPERAGVAIVGGPVGDESGVAPLLDALEGGWPAVVVRTARAAGPAVRVEPALPWVEAADVLVATRLAGRPENALPAPPDSVLRSLFAGTLEPRRRWFRHWRGVWELAR